MRENLSVQTFETELKLIIMHKNPLEIAQKISAQTHLAGYPLNHKDNVFIKDIYFDTPEKSLQQKRFALRIRVQNQQAYVTIKGKTHIQEDGAIRRLEIEKEWSQQSWMEIISLLKAEKILPESVQPLKFNDSHSALSSAGLEPIQERTTDRQIRQVMDRDRKKTLAELAIDKAIYQLHDKEIMHYEIEIESKATTEENILKNCWIDFQAVYPDCLEIWTINKLELGFLLKEWSKLPEFGKIKKEHQLSPNEYQVIKDIYQGRIK